MAKLNIQEYKDKVIQRFRSNKATEGNWELLGKLFLNASENGDEGLEDFDACILSSQEFKELYKQLEEFQNYSDQPPGYPFFLDGMSTSTIISGDNDNDDNN